MSARNLIVMNQKNPTLTTAREVFLDLIFYDLERLPALGEELKTNNFAISVGGGAAITAVVAARLGRSSQIVSVWGDSAIDSQAQVEAAGVGLGGCHRERQITSGITVSVSTREDRYFLTFPGANRFIESHLLSADVVSQLRKADHVHFALSPQNWEPFYQLVRLLKDDGITTSWPATFAAPSRPARPAVLPVCRRGRNSFMEKTRATGSTRGQWTLRLEKELLEKASRGRENPERLLDGYHEYLAQRNASYMAVETGKAIEGTAIARAREELYQRAAGYERIAIDVMRAISANPLIRSREQARALLDKIAMSIVPGSIT